MDATNGLYFKHEDYAGFWRRLVIDLIDVFVVACICLTLAITLGAAFPSSESIGDATLATCTTIVLSYFVILKRSRMGTVGYRVGGVRIVGMNGQPPSWSSLILRLLFAALGPFNVLLDLGWLPGDYHRQALRDKFAHTYVVRRKAQPIGTGRVVYRNYEICGWNFMFREIEVKTPTNDA